MNLNERKPELGFYSADGTIVPVTQLSADSLAYIGYTVPQLQDLLEEKISFELYEHCALIRDELLRRAGKLQ